MDEKTKDSGKILVVPDTAIVIVRSDEEIAKAVMSAGPAFGKIHKQHYRDHFILRNSK